MKNTADYRTIEMVIHALDERVWEYSGAEEIAARVGLSKDCLDTVFARWAGVGLTRFMQSLTLSQTRKRLLETRGQLAGWPQPGPAGTGHHDFWICCQVRLLPSGQEKGQGTGKRSEVKTSGLTITYGLYPSPFGDCLLAMIGREICHLSFVDEGKLQVHLEELRHNWPQATIIADEGQSGRQVVARIFTPAGVEPIDPISLLLKGTPFQIRVWQALLTLPRGTMISYQDLAAYIGHPTACRAVASAVAANPVGYLIPCHRVIRKSGEIHHYRWGSSRKKAMLGWEVCAS
ncbi:MAG: methylated-DNA--[protein]-cysteine S-methyltransferase [Deltaproteobacteria bacterium]|nr:methylated-DNA--[protein]-cysteine S-methyltransferase [Deltaproteobacteria bacterium]